MKELFNSVVYRLALYAGTLSPAREALLWRQELCHGYGHHRRWRATTGIVSSAPLNSYWTASAHKRSRTHDSHAVGRPPCQRQERSSTYAKLRSVCSTTQATILLRVPRGRPAPTPCACIPALCASIPRFLLERLELGHLFSK